LLSLQTDAEIPIDGGQREEDDGLVKDRYVQAENGCDESPAFPSVCADAW
jgi:hypothetical protein